MADAAAIGVASMVGAGVFTVFAPAADVAGRALVVALALAAGVAWCNASSSARLAARRPTSGGTYVHGREQLGPWWGYLAGWSFVVGKTASCAAMALAFAAYVVPGSAPEPVGRLVAAGAVVALTLVNCRGVTRTAGLAKAIALLALVVLAVAVVVGLLGADGLRPPLPTGDVDAYGVLQAAGLLFFAFAGYARIATLGEEVRDPARTIPRAIGLSFAVVLTTYVVVALALLAVLGPARVAGSVAPVRALAEVGGATWTGPVIQVGAAAAALGALLALVAGIGRTSLAMARDGELPRWLDAVHPTYDVPHRAELAVGACVVALVLTLDLRDAVGFSSFGVLLYYLVANLAAGAQRRREGLGVGVVPVVGAVGCVVLAFALPVASVVGGCVVVGLGVLVRVGVRRLRPV